MPKTYNEGVDVFVGAEDKRNEELLLQNGYCVSVYFQTFEHSGIE